LTPTRIKLARVVAISADVVQIVFFPLFAEGFISPFDDALDVIVCGVLTYLVGWHISFLPSFMLKLMPAVDLVPTWTLAVLFATRQKSQPLEKQATEVYVEPTAPPRIGGPVERQP
jgi:hypothetical protein